MNSQHTSTFINCSSLSIKSIVMSFAWRVTVRSVFQFPSMTYHHPLVTPRLNSHFSSLIYHLKQTPEFFTQKCRWKIRANFGLLNPLIFISYIRCDLMKLLSSSIKESLWDFIYNCTKTMLDKHFYSEATRLTKNPTSCRVRKIMMDFSEILRSAIFMLTQLSQNWPA